MGKETIDKFYLRNLETFPLASKKIKKYIIRTIIGDIGKANRA